jgi:hypothetical protein
MNPERVSRVYNDWETAEVLFCHFGKGSRDILVHLKSGILGINDGLGIVNSRLMEMLAVRR